MKKKKRKILQEIQIKRGVYTKKREKQYRKGKRRPLQQRLFEKLVKNSLSMKLPKVFSLKRNTNETIKFVNDLKLLKDEKKRIYINMKYVEDITNGAIALLLSVINDFTSRGKRIIGSKPKNKIARKTLELSGFFDYMNSELEYYSENNPNTIVEQGMKVVEPKRSSEIVRDAMKTITGKEQRNTRIQRLFIELMSNSVNHGFPNNGSKKKWMIATSHFKAEKKVSFSFIDNGVGIINTLNQKLGRQILTFFKGKEDLLESAFNGDIGSRTKLEYRGKGLPTIKNTFTNNHISNLFVLTNGVIIDYSKSKSYELEVPYSGTFYHFELNNENITNNEN